MTLNSGALTLRRRIDRMSIDDLQWFDRLARREIDPALELVIRETGDQYLDYIVYQQPLYSPL